MVSACKGFVVCERGATPGRFFPLKAATCKQFCLALLCGPKAFSFSLKRVYRPQEKGGSEEVADQMDDDGWMDVWGPPA